MLLGRLSLKRSSFAVICLYVAALVSPALAQTQIGGGACNSSYLKGTYAISLTGRQVNGSATFENVLQANGFATFDGLSSASFTLIENIKQASGASLNWSGTFSVPANCAATVTISTGGSATLNVMIYGQGKDFAITGSDGTYSYSGSGVAQPTGCSTASLDGVYVFNSTGFETASDSVSGALNAIGSLLFDGQGNLTANLTTSTIGESSNPLSLTGTYTLSSNCLGSANLTDSSSNSYVMNFSVYSLSASSANFYATLARTGQMTVSGDAHSDYPSPASGTCSASSLNGTYSLSMSGREIQSNGIFAGSLQAVGAATFDGNGSVTLAGTENTSAAQGQSFSYAGTYTLPATCFGTLTANGVQWTLVVWNSGASFAMIGQDGTHVLSATGVNTAPPACAAATLSGEYIFSASGFTEVGNVPATAQDEAGVLQFDGQGNISASLTETQSGAMPSSVSVMGTYEVGPGCTASATLNASGIAESMDFVISGAHGETLDVLAADSQFERLGSAHSAFGNPSQAIGNVASYAYSATPPGSVFTIFGQQLATKTGGAVTNKLPTELLATSVTVNGNVVPLFYVDTGQIDAQMPWDIPGNAIASVVVTNGMSTSNAAAVYVPATGTPGISTYGNNRAVVVNADGNANTASDQASVGDEVVVYFTGGGPVQASGTLTTGSPDPNGLSPVTAPLSITVGGLAAAIDYIGLTPGSIGLYQANFNVPQIGKGTYPVVITISGYVSNAPVMSVSN